MRARLTALRFASIRPHPAADFYPIPHMRPEPINPFVILEVGALAITIAIFISIFIHRFAIGIKGSIATVAIGIVIGSAAVLYLHHQGSI